MTNIFNHVHVLVMVVFGSIIVDVILVWLLVQLWSLDLATTASITKMHDNEDNYEVLTSTAAANGLAFKRAAPLDTTFFEISFLMITYNSIM